MAFLLCMTSSLSIEEHIDKVSITQQAEKLDIAEMLKRAQMGILDLKSFERPHSGDMSSPDSDNPDIIARETSKLFAVPGSVLDRTFGSSLEEASSEVRRNRKIASQFIKKDVSNDPNEPTTLEQGEGEDK